MKKDNIKVSHTRSKAEWLDYHYLRKCSNCGSSTCWTDDEGTELPSNFCPNCGFRMEYNGRKAE